jgi:hypothetical protein
MKTLGKIIFNLLPLKFHLVGKGESLEVAVSLFSFYAKIATFTGICTKETVTIKEVTLHRNFTRIKNLTIGKVIYTKPSNVIKLK